MESDDCHPDQKRVSSKNEISDKHSPSFLFLLLRCCIRRKLALIFSYCQTESSMMKMPWRQNSFFSSLTGPKLVSKHETIEQEKELLFAYDVLPVMEKTKVWRMDVCHVNGDRARTETVDGWIRFTDIHACSSAAAAIDYQRVGGVSSTLPFNIGRMWIASFSSFTVIDVGLLLLLLLLHAFQAARSN